MTKGANGDSPEGSTIQRCLKQPILNNPYEYPAHHWQLDAYSDDADHRFRQADRRFRAMPIIMEERRSIGRCAWERGRADSTVVTALASRPGGSDRACS